MGKAIDWQVKSRSFDQVAEIYDAFRPDYPEALVEAVVNKSGIPAGGKILEIGGGTGKATLPFARRGYEILCVEPGENLAKVAQDNLRDWPKVRWEIATFQDSQANSSEFDLVTSAQAFHWVPRPAGYFKVVEVLKPAGCLAIFWNMHLEKGGQVFEDLERVYRERAPEMDDGLGVEVVIRQREQEIRDCGCFSSLEVCRFPWTRRYDTRQYLGLLNTFSDHLLMGETQRAYLFEGVAEVLEQHGGGLDKPYQAILYLARAGK